MNTAIVTLDIINELCHPEGKLARYADRIASHSIVPNLNKITAWGRQKSYLIIHVRVGFRDDYQDCSIVSPVFKLAKQNQVLKLTAWGGQFCDELQREKQDIEIVKHRISAFYNTDLDLILRANNIEQLILTGIATNNAVELTAREAHDRDYQVTIIGDATECSDAAAQQASLNFLTKIAVVKTTAGLIE